MKVLYYCEKCGKPVYEKFGSGRFCSRSCANSHAQTEAMNESRRLKLKKTPDYFCSNCGIKLFKKNSSGYCRKCYYKLVPYSEERKKKQSDAMKGKTRWNIHRNQQSYAEKFFENVLTNNNIEFKREFQVAKDSDYHCYYLDFLVSDKFDLEIDGAQHKYRTKEDAERDSYLESIGYTVYRIKWNDINSARGKLEMKTKIDNLLDILNTAQ